MKGWVALFAERHAAEEKMRRVHVQAYLRGFNGFCTWCRAVYRVGEVTVHGAECAVQQGKRRRLLMTDWGATTVIVTVNDQKYETENTGWTCRCVRSEKYWTKTLKEGVTALLHHIEAMQKGVVMEKEGKAQPTFPSAFTPVSVAPYRPSLAAPRPVPKAQVDLSEWNIATQLSKEARRLSEGLDRAEQLRRQHLQKYSNR